MEKAATLDRGSVIHELTRGMELANEVKRQLCPSSNSREACGFLVEKIVSCYDNALAILDYMALLENGYPNLLVSHSLIEGSQRSEVSDQDSKDHVCKDVSKKRKIQPRWSEQVHQCSGTGSEGQLNDGYYWRKYGQKDILGANYPRAYYRCTHRQTQGCLATKQVQRADEDPSIFRVSYRGKHSCVQERIKKDKENANVVMGKEESHENTPQQMMMISTELAHRVESENVGKFVGCSPLFLSPATSESYFSMSELEFAEIVSNSNHSLDTDFPLGDLDFLIDQVDFDSHFLDAADCL